MSADVDASVSGLIADYAALHSPLDRIAESSSDALSERDVAEVAVAHERAVWRLGSIGLRRIMDVADRGAYGSVGCRSLREFMEKVPAVVGPVVHDAAEASLAGFARTLSPREITKAGVRILAHLYPDGRLTDDRDRARPGKPTVGAHDSQLMSHLSGSPTPTTRALFDVVLAALAAGDEQPRRRPLTPGRRVRHRDRPRTARRGRQTR